MPDRKMAFDQLSDEQIAFICSEVGTAKEALFAIDYDKYLDMYDVMCDIEVDAAIESIEAGDAPLSERGQLATDIVTIIGNAFREDDEE